MGNVLAAPEARLKKLPAPKGAPNEPTPEDEA
jgi:hypothetical protein